MREDEYAASLAERVQTSSIDELKTLLAFFDCSELRQRNADLLRQVQEELERRGVDVP